MHYFFPSSYSIFSPLLVSSIAWPSLGFILHDLTCPSLSMTRVKQRRAVVRGDRTAAVNTFLGSAVSCQLPSTHHLSVPDCSRPVACDHAWGLPAICTDGLRWWGQDIMCQNQMKPLEIIANSCSRVSIKWIDPPTWASEDVMGQYCWALKQRATI